MEGVISLPCTRIHKKQETKRLNNRPGNFVETFYKDWMDWLDVIDFSRDIDFQQEVLKNRLSEYINKYLLATSEFGQEIGVEIDLYVTIDRLNEASFRRKLDPISKNIIENKNPIELLFKGLKHFDTQNPAIGSSIREFQIGKKMI